MRLLLDSHFIVTQVRGEKRKAHDWAEKLLANPSVVPFVSVASLWELALKWRLGRLVLPFHPREFSGFFKAVGLEVIDITEAHVTADVSPLPETSDPFDRLLLAQCQVENMRLVTVDEKLVDHPLAVQR